MAEHQMRKLARSQRPAPAGERIGDAADDQTVRLTVVLKPKTPCDLTGPALSREDYARLHGSDQAVVDQVVAYAKTHGLTVESADPATHLVRLSGPLSAARAAFAPEGLGRYRVGGRAFTARDGHVSVPEQFAPHVTAVMGFDERPVAQPRFRIRPAAHAQNVSYTPVQVAQHYGFPTEVTGSGQTVALIELGGGYDDQQMAQYFQSIGVKRSGTLEAVGVDGADNQADSDPSGADGEVQLDIEVVGAVAPGANIAVYFGPNQGNGFLDAISAAVNDSQRKPSVISISWGGPESGWSAQDIDAMDQVFQKAAAVGITVTAASGDNGADDGTQAKVVDFPASSPHVLGCGGTSLPSNGHETAWNDGSQGGATGGGYSTHFSKPSWQSGNSHKQRGVPDVAGDADPQTGYAIAVDGQSTVIGGTSAVAPLWAGLIALSNQSSGKAAGFANPVLYAASGAFTDITTGNNSGYSAAKGWDPVTGLGSPKGAAILQALSGKTTAIA